MENIKTTQNQKFTRLLILFPLNYGILLVILANSIAPILKDNVYFFNFALPIFVPLFMVKIDITKEKMMVYSLIITMINGFVSFLVALVFLSGPFTYMIVTFISILYIIPAHGLFSKFEKREDQSNNISSS